MHLYVLDCDSGGLTPLARLPHCGAAVRRTEKERAARLLDRLASEIVRRQDLLASAGFTSIREQRSATERPDRLPFMVLLLDQWEGFLADLGQVDNGRLLKLMTRLLSEGTSAGLRVVATGGKVALASLTSQFPDRLVLRMPNPNDLLLTGVPKGAMPSNPSPGRSIIMPRGTEVQVAFVGHDPASVAQIAALDVMIRDATEASRHFAPAPLRVDMIPARISLNQARAIPGWAATRGTLQPMVAVGGDELAGLGINLARFPGFAIAGPPMSGRSTALLVIAGSLLETGTAIIGFTPRESPLRHLAGHSGVLAVFTGKSPDPQKLRDLLDSVAGPLAVLVDDAEALHQTPVAEVLAQIPTEGRRLGHALVIAGTSGGLLRARQGFTATARQYRCGMLLTPEAPQLGQELFGTRLPRSAAFDWPPGRGYLIPAGQAILVQVPELGVDPATGKPMVIMDGRFGPYVTEGEIIASSGKGDDMASITDARAAELLTERRPAGPSTGKRATTARRGVRIVLGGPPGAGKGTQAQFVASHLAIPRISTGDILRYNVTNNTELGRKAREFMERGDLAPDEMIVAMVRDRLTEDDAQEGFLLDGFPRNVPQAETLKKMLAAWETRLSVVLELIVDKDEVVRRLSGRRTCRRCERVWHMVYAPSARSGICDDCGGELFQRDDDSEETVRHKLEVYAEQTAPLMAFYAKENILIGIDATGPVEEITSRALAALRPFVR